MRKFCTKSAMPGHTLGTFGGMTKSANIIHNAATRAPKERAKPASNHTRAPLTNIQKPQKHLADTLLVT